MFIILFRCKANLAFHKSNILLHKQHGHPFEQLQPPFLFFLLKYRLQSIFAI